MKNKTIICFVLAQFMLSFAFSGIVVNSVANYNGITIVLDAGHGGRDGGCVGANGTIEKEINLEYVLSLKEKLVKAGYRVELTRKNDDGLYKEFSTNKKQSDMQTRFSIIKRTNPNLVVSVHMNSFRDKSASGANTYYRLGDKASCDIANLIQKSLFESCGAKTTSARCGDYYMLNCSYYTSVLIECGFLSNKNEEKMLNTDEYKDKIVDAIFSAIVLYYGNVLKI